MNMLTSTLTASDLPAHGPASDPKCRRASNALNDRSRPATGRSEVTGRAGPELPEDAVHDLAMVFPLLASTPVFGRDLALRQTRPNGCSYVGQGTETEEGRVPEAFRIW
jgi:hypothetical protein